MNVEWGQVYSRRVLMYSQLESRQNIEVLEAGSSIKVGVYSTCSGKIV